jgi:hypothetical protein
VPVWWSQHELSLRLNRSNKLLAKRAIASVNGCFGLSYPKVTDEAPARTLSIYETALATATMALAQTSLFRLLC